MAETAHSAAPDDQNWFSVLLQATSELVGPIRSSRTLPCKELDALVEQMTKDFPADKELINTWKDYLLTFAAQSASFTATSRELEYTGNATRRFIDGVIQSSTISLHLKSAAVEMFQQYQAARKLGQSPARRLIECKTRTVLRRVLEKYASTSLTADLAEFAVTQCLDEICGQALQAQPTLEFLEEANILTLQAVDTINENVVASVMLDILHDRRPPLFEGITLETAESKLAHRITQHFYWMPTLTKTFGRLAAAAVLTQ